MDPRALRRTLLWLFIGFLGLSALVAIVAVLGDGFGDLQARICGSSGAISGASVCALACAAFRERERGRVLGTIGIALAGIAAAAILLLIWSDAGEPPWKWKVTLVLTIWAVATAHAELLWLPRLRANHRWAQRTLIGGIAVLTLLLTTMILGDAGGEAMVRLMVVVAILVTLLTLVVPILWKIGAIATDEVVGAGERLVLRREPDGAWVDDRGARYEVRRLTAQ